MSEGNVLVNLAAQGVAPVIKGCSKAIALFNSQQAEALPKAISFFGPRIVERWLANLTARSKPDQINALTELAALPLPASRLEAEQSFQNLGVDAGPEDRSVAIEYLSALPLAVRKSLIQDPETGRMTLPATVVSDDAQALIRLLPQDVPPFPIGSDLPGTPYFLEELLGLGGFGCVYRAKNRFEQNQPPRAIKFCLDASMLATLHRERAILDRLMSVDGSKWSERIVRLYGFALDAKPPFLVYEYVPGGDLTSLLQATREKTQRGFRPALCIELMKQVAEALAFAHAHGMVHRDLKPANVLVHGSKIKLTDFGIGGVVATHAVRSGGISVGGSMFNQMNAADQARLFRGSGTPLYMSPEQRRGDQPDPRHDLYSLGVMWYQLLCGDVTRELHPGWPDELIEEYQVPREHIEVIQRCVGYFKKRPAHAGELLAMLAEAAKAKKEDPTAVTQRMPPGAAPAAPPAAAPAAVAAAPTAPPAATAPAAAPPAAAVPGAAPSAPVAAVPAAAPPGAAGRNEFEQRHHDAEFEKLRQKLTECIERDNFEHARDVVTAMLELRPGDPETLEVRGFLDERLSSPMTELGKFSEHQGWVRSVAVSPDGKRAVSGSDDRVPILWDLTTRKPIQVFQGHTASVMSVAFAPTGRCILSGSWDATVRLWDVETGKELRRYEGKFKEVKCVCFSPDGNHIVMASDDRVYLIATAGGEELLALEGHDDVVQSVAFSPEGLRAVSGSDDGTIRVWNLQDGTSLANIKAHNDTVTCVAFAPNGKWVLSGSSDNSARLWDFQTGKELRRFVGHSCWVNCVAFAPTALRVLTGSGGTIVDGQFAHGADCTLRIWDLQTERELFRHSGHEASVTCAAFAPAGKIVLSGSLDKTVRMSHIPG
ncbi:MAG: WD40 repeat domain-containing serine/threonine protein kinase [Gemmataceae bacterium]